MTKKSVTPLQKLRNLFYKKASGVDSFLPQASGVVHIGANTGQERDLYARYGLDVIWVEPIPDVFAELQRNIATHARQAAYRYLLTDKDDEDTSLNIANNNGAASSIFDIGELSEIWPEIDYTSKVNMKSTTFASFVTKESIDLSDYDTLVMDTQGSELMVLKGAGALLSNFRFIKTEAADFEAYIGCCQLKELSAYLSGFGFREVIRTPFPVSATNGTYYDVLYDRQDGA